MWAHTPTRGKLWPSPLSYTICVCATINNSTQEKRSSCHSNSYAVHIFAGREGGFSRARLPGRCQYLTWIFGRAEKAWSKLNWVKCLRAFKKGLSFPRFRSSIYFFGSNFLYGIKTCYRAGDVPAEPPGSLLCLEDVPISTGPRKLHQRPHTSNRRKEFPLCKYLLFPFWHQKQHLKRDRDSWILHSESAWTQGLQAKTMCVKAFTLNHSSYTFGSCNRFSALSLLILYWYLHI